MASNCGGEELLQRSGRDDGQKWAGRGTNREELRTDILSSCHPVARVGALPDCNAHRGLLERPHRKLYPGTSGRRFHTSFVISQVASVKGMEDLDPNQTSMLDKTKVFTRISKLQSNPSVYGLRVHKPLKSVDFTYKLIHLILHIVPNHFKLTIKHFLVLSE